MKQLCYRLAAKTESLPTMTDDILLLVTIGFVAQTAACGPTATQGC
jgi:hypothetical protein